MTIMEMARELGKVIQESDEYKALAEARTASDNDEDLQKQIEQFNVLRMKIEIESGKDDADQDKISSLNEDLMNLYTEIMQGEKMVAFNAAKETMDSLMNEVTMLLTAAVNGEDPATYDPAAAACTGSCATCGGCS